MKYVLSVLFLCALSTWFGLLFFSVHILISQPVVWSGASGSSWFYFCNAYIFIICLAEEEEKNTVAPNL